MWGVWEVWGVEREVKIMVVVDYDYFGYEALQWEHLAPVPRIPFSYSNPK